MSPPMRAGPESFDQLPGAQRARAEHDEADQQQAPRAMPVAAPGGGAAFRRVGVAQEREHQDAARERRDRAARQRRERARAAQSTAPTSQPTRLSAVRRWNEQARQANAASSRNSAVWLLLTNGPVSSVRGSAR